MDIDLDELSKSELEKLKAKVDKAIVTVEERRRKKAIEAAQLAAKEHGFSLDDLVSGPSSAKAARVAKYRNPDDASQTWTGRGRKPGWLNDALKGGRALEDFEI